MNYPCIKLVVPTPLKQYKNGQLAPSVLAPVKTGGKMYAPVAEQFNKMYDVDGLKPEEFTNFGATLRTLRGFLQSVNDLEAFVRDVTVPNPDK